MGVLSSTKTARIFEPLPPFPGLWCTCRMALLCHSAWKIAMRWCRRNLKNQSLSQWLYENQILTVLQLFLAVRNIKGMHFCIAEMVEYADQYTQLEERMQKARTVPGTLQLHGFIPLSTETVEVRQFSSSPICRVEQVLLKDATPCIPSPVVRICHSGI